MPNDKSLKKIINDALVGDAKSSLIVSLRQALSEIVDNVIQFKKDLTQRVDVALADLQGMKGRVDIAIAGIKDGKDGMDSTVPGPKGDRGEPGADSKVPGPEGKPGKPGKDGSPDTGEEIIKKINSDKSDRLIRKGKVEGLADIESLARTADANARSWGNSGTFVYAQDISASLNGVLKTFTLVPNAHVVMVFASSAPGVFRPTIDYTTTATAITFTSAVDAGSTLNTGQTVIILYKLV